MLQLAAADMDLASRILIVDDDPGIRELTASFLQQHGYLVETAIDGAEMRRKLAQDHYALVVLDVMMPGEDGLTILRSLDRATSPAVIVLSVIGEEVDKIVGLEMGEDDYLAKPANPRELLARIRSVLRRNAGRPAGGSSGRQLPAGGYRRFAGWRLDPLARQLLDPDEVVINLSDGEFRLLMALVDHPRRVLTRDFLLDHARGAEAEHFDRAIDVQVSRLRRKLQRSDGKGGDELIRTVRTKAICSRPMSGAERRRGGGRSVAVSIVVLVVAAMATASAVLFVVTFNGPSPRTNPQPLARIVAALKSGRLPSGSGRDLLVSDGDSPPVPRPGDHPDAASASRLAALRGVPPKTVVA